ncbi:MAG: TonB-dependent receptor [Pseudomonadota bacterium]
MLIAVMTAMLSPAVQPAPNEANAPETIIVTGERINRSILDTASSITVFNQEQIAREADRHVNQLLRQAPNLLVEGVSETPVVRGIQGGGPGGLASGASAGTLPRLTVILDGVPQIANLPNSAFSDLYDVQQVEVLRGPQTTLFGRNALGGAIVVETNDPTTEFEAGTQTTIAADGFSAPDHTVAGFISGPIKGEALRGRLTVQYQDGEDPRNVEGSPSGADTGFLTEFDSLRIRGKLLSDLTTDIGEVKVKAVIDYQEGTTPQTRNTVIETDAVSGDRPLHDRLIAFDGPNRTFDNDALSSALDIEIDRGNGLKLQSISSLTNVDYSSVDEQVFPSRFDSDEEFFAQDLILHVEPEGAKITGLVGLAFEERNQTITIEGVPLNISADTESNQFSAFTDLRITLSDTVDLIAGGRILTIDQTRTQTSATLFPTPGGIVSIAGDVAIDDRETAYLPSAGIIWRPIANQSLRMTYKEGFNPGGASVNFFTGEPFVFDSEELRAFEAGWQGQFLGDRLYAGLTGFFNAFDDQQFFLETVPGDRFSIVVTNVPRSRSYGGEFEVTFQPHDDFRTTLGIGVLETDIVEGPSTNRTLDGNEFGRDPALTASAAVAWQATEWLSLDANAAYASSYFPDFANVAGSKVGDYALVDLGATLHQKRFDVRLFARNVADSEAVTSRVGGFAVLAEPRTLGVSITTRIF